MSSDTVNNPRFIYNGCKAEQTRYACFLYTFDLVVKSLIEAVVEILDTKWKAK